MTDIYHKGNREFQEQFDSRKLADLLDGIIVHDAVTDEERGFIESRDMFFISTVDEQGRPTVSYKGGEVGFVRVVDEKTIVFPSYDGNGMFLTAGNIAAHNEVGLLFIDFENPQRLRMHGTASITPNDVLLGEYVDAQYIIRVAVRNLFVNCPRYIHQYKKIEQSPYIPKEGCEAAIPDWKKLDVVQDVLPKNA
jgi:predicted pyridoxine 5'-phosphate oxidase superfamily flavin-nucleotide-binding protein